MAVVLLSSDLSVISRVDGAAAAAGTSARSASTVDDAIERCRAEGARLLIVDLGMLGIDTKSLVARVRAEIAGPPRIIAFGSHVHVDKLAAAREAGCDLVTSRGQFFAQAAQLLQSL